MIRIQCDVCQVDMQRIYKRENKYGVLVDIPYPMFRCPKCGDKIRIKI